MLEFLTEIVNYAALTVYVQAHPKAAGHQYPILLNWTDNTTAKAWIRKAALKSQVAKNLQYILCGLMINNPLGVTCHHIAGDKNITADTLSRIYTNSNIPPTPHSLLQNLPKLQGYARFHPSPELLSLLFSALSREFKPGLHRPKMLGHFCPASNTSVPLSEI